MRERRWASSSCGRSLESHEQSTDAPTRQWLTFVYPPQHIHMMLQSGGMRCRLVSLRCIVVSW